jgi:hypothetical protein
MWVGCGNGDMLQQRSFTLQNELNFRLVLDANNFTVTCNTNELSKYYSNSSYNCQDIFE